MKKNDLLAALHTSLTQIKHILKSQGITGGYKANITEIETTMNQYPKMSSLHGGRLFAKTDEVTMLQAISAVIENFALVVNNDLHKQATVIEAEMHGTQNYSEYELKRTEDYATKIELVSKLQQMITMIDEERMDSKKNVSPKLK